MAAPKDARAAKRKSLANSLLTTAAVLAGLVLLNVGFYGVTRRLDLSGGGLTAASERLVADLDEPLQVTAYFGRVPVENAYEQEHVELLLERYADASGSKLAWRKVDPFARGVEFQRKLKADEGIDKQLWLSMVDDTPQQVPVYFHVQFKYVGKTEVWLPPRQFSLTGLEYQFSSIIKRLAYDKKLVGVSSGFGSPQQVGAITAILSSSYDVVPVDLSQPTPAVADLDVLVVNGPSQPLSDAALMAIDAHVLAGKPTLFLIRGMTFTTPQTQPGMAQPPDQPYMGMPTQAGLDKLLGHYGVRIRAGIILDQRAATAGAVLIGQQGLVVKELFPLVEVLARGDGDALQGMTNLIPMPFASRVTLIEDFEDATGGLLEANTLTRSSASSYERISVVVITKDTNLAIATADQRGPIDTGYSLTGSFPSFFAATSDSAPAGSAGHMSPSTTRMIVFGSAEFASDATLGMAQRHPLFRPLGAGVNVLQNMVDWLAQDQALVAARNKGVPPPIDPLDPDTRRWVKYGNTFGVAALLLLIGLVAWFLRERRRRNVSL